MQQTNDTAEITQLREIVKDESLSVKQRRHAAAHVLQLIVAGVPEPGADNHEVVERMKPWPRETEMQASLAEMMDRITGARATQGWSLADAKSEVWKRNRMRAVLAVVVNEDAGHLERLAACDVILSDFMHPAGTHRRNSWTPDKMLSSILPSTATKITNFTKPPIEVSRPPMELRDVWRM